MKVNLLGISIWKFHFNVRWYSDVKWWEWGFRRLGPGRFSIDTWSLGWIFEDYR